MTLAKIKDPGGGLPILITEQGAVSPDSGRWGQVGAGGAGGWDCFIALLPWWPEGPCPLEQKGRVGRGASEGKEAC